MATAADVTKALQAWFHGRFPDSSSSVSSVAFYLDFIPSDDCGVGHVLQKTASFLVIESDSDTPEKRSRPAEDHARELRDRIEAAAEGCDRCIVRILPEVIELTDVERGEKVRKGYARLCFIKMDSPRTAV